MKAQAVRLRGAARFAVVLKLHSGCEPNRKEQVYVEGCRNYTYSAQLCLDRAWPDHTVRESRAGHHRGRDGGYPELYGIRNARSAVDRHDFVQCGQPEYSMECLR